MGLEALMKEDLYTSLNFQKLYRTDNYNSKIRTKGN